MAAGKKMFANALDEDAAAANGERVGARAASRGASCERSMVILIK
jgi:hypothetical protein